MTKLRDIVLCFPYFTDNSIGWETMLYNQSKVGTWVKSTTYVDAFWESTIGLQVA